MEEQATTITVFDSTNKDSLPWKEEFTLADQTTTDDGKTSWTATRSKGVFEVRENALFINEKGEEGVFQTGEINIFSGPVNISLDIVPQGGVDSGDYVSLYQIVDGGKEQLIGEIKGRDTVPTTLQGTALGQKLILILRAKVSSEDEVFILDNLTVNPQ